MLNKDMLDNVFSIFKEFDKKLRQEFDDIDGIDIARFFLSYGLRELYRELQKEYKGVENIENVMIDTIVNAIREIVRKLNKDADTSDRGSYRFRIFLDDWNDSSSLWPYLDREIEELINRKVIKYTVKSQIIIELIARVNNKEEFNKYMLSHHLTNNKNQFLNKIASDIAYAFKRKFFDDNQQEV